MAVYLDLILLLNLCIDFLLIWLTASLRKVRLKIGRALAASFIGCSYSVMVFWPELSFLFSHLIKLLFALLMVWISFGFRDLRTYLRNLGTFYLVSFAIAGGIFALQFFFLSQSEVLNGIVITHGNGMGKPVLWGTVIVGFAVMFFFSKGTFSSVLKRQQLGNVMADVTVEWNGEITHCKGLVDTGNQLYDPLTRTPVMIMEVSHLKDCLPSKFIELTQGQGMEDFYQQITDVDLSLNWQQRLRLIPYRGLNKGMQFLVALKPDKVVIEQNGNRWELTRVLIGLDGGNLSSDGAYQAIVHPSLMLQESC